MVPAQCLSQDYNQVVSQDYGCVRLDKARESPSKNTHKSVGQIPQFLVMLASPWAAHMWQLACPRVDNDDNDDDNGMCV